MTEPLDMPDGPGWWAFEGSEWVQKKVGCSKEDSDGWQEGEWDEGDEPSGYYYKYVEVPGKMLQIVLFIRQVRKGEAFWSRYRSAPYDGNGELGYIMPHQWYSGLNGLDKLTGKWTRLTMPWEENK